MASVVCTRCGSTAEGLDKAPLPGDVGEQVRNRTCRTCWRDWLAMQVKLINENRLSPVDPEHFRRLVEEMKTFLNLERD